MNGAAERGALAPDSAGADTRGDVVVADEVREIAAHMIHVAQLATTAAGGAEPERGARHLHEFCAEVGARIAALNARVGSAAVVLAVVSTL
jgi:hypothetical protein